MSETVTRILVVEDEYQLAQLLKDELEHEGFEADTESNGRIAYDRLLQGAYSLVLLDVNLPDMDGFTICRKARAVGNTTPIIMVTAKDQVVDKVNGLDIGANDYVTKPFDMMELLARIRAHIRDSAGQKQGPSQILQVKQLVMDLSMLEVKVGDEPVKLTKTEFELLKYLMENKNHIVSRDQILNNVWGNEFYGDNNVDVYISVLRQKLDNHFGEKFIHTHRGFGYCIRD